MSETPIYDALAEQYKLTDYQIENPSHERVETHNFNLEADETIDASIWNIPERSHETVQPPVFELETLSHEQQLQRAYEAAPDFLIIKDITDAGRNLSAERQRVAA